MYATEGKKTLKSEKKCLRKQKRAQHRLAKDMKVESVEEPTQYLAICNAGLVTGLQRETLESLINELEPVHNTVMPFGKSYCFVNFFKPEKAKLFYQRVHGIVQVPGQNTVFYLCFVKEIPGNYDENLGHELPPGLKLIPDFITNEEESLLLNSIDWHEENSESELKYRKVKHYGYKFRYDNNLVDVDEPIAPIPQAFEFVQELFKKHGCGHFKYDQLTINHYLPGQGIPPHIDTHSAFEDPILSLSLGSGCAMDFKKGEEKVSVELPARSLLIMSGECRYAWSHGICPRHNDVVRGSDGPTTRPRATRLSFTFRKVRKGACRCDYPDFCDTKRTAPAKEATAIDDSVAASLENCYVHDVYEQISSHFDETRHKQWPNVTRFIESIQPGGVLLDVGCGNGKYLDGQPGLFKMGCDRSTGLVAICRSRAFQMVQADCLQLPYKSGCLDAALCIAVIHHLSTSERRARAVREILRTLAPGGRALIYVWAKEQSVDSARSSYLKSGANRRAGASLAKFHPVEDKLALPVHENRTEFAHSDVLVPWKRKGGGDFLRFYHVFARGELEALCQAQPGGLVDSSYYDQGNWCVVLRKL